MDWPMVLSLMTVCMWLGLATWVYLDARRTGRVATWNAVATFLLPGLGLAVYLGSRAARERGGDDQLSATGHRLLQEMTEEVKRLRSRNDELEEALSQRSAADGREASAT
jgi:hypothetical protein